MDKYEYRVKTEQMLEYVDQKDYKKAMEIADTIDWRRVKNASMLNSVSEIYEFNGEFSKSRDILFLAYDRSPSSRKIVYRLGILALKLKDTEEATDCYEEFVKLAPKDPNQYILKYKILKTQNASLMNQIEALEEFKRAEYVEKWAYELAVLYQEAGMISECLEECDDLILWFSEGRYVYQAMELKMKYKPLTPLQQDKYDSRPGTAKAKKAATEYAPVVEEPIVEEVAEEAEEVVIPEEMEIQVDSKQEKPVKESPIRQIVTGATLQEALASGMALATGAVAAIKAGVAEITSQIPTDKIREAVEEPVMKEIIVEEPVAEELVVEEIIIEEPVAEEPVVEEIVIEEPAEEKVRPVSEVLFMTGELNLGEKALAQKDEEIKLSGLMMIDDILAQWEEKQKINASAIEKQKREDEERLRKEREEIARRREAERIERERLEAEAARKAAEEAARKAAEEEAARKAAEEAARKAAEEEEARKAAILEAARKAAERVGEKKTLEAKTQRLPDDILQLMEQLESRVAEPEKVRKDDLEDDFEEDFEEDDLQYELVEETEEAPEPLRTDGLDELAIAMGSFEEEEDDFEEDDFEEDDFEEDDFEEDDFEEDDFEEDDFEEDDFDDEFEEDELPQITDLEEAFKIEEPSEEEIQSRINKSKGGVPFDTGFVVTGRYDLSATSEIGLKMGLTEEQKKLFSYFVPVRGMSEQIVEALDNDRRSQKEGTSKTGNILVIGHKGSGKTVLSVDIVKAIQKQRNLKQGKVAIVTGESLNKKELPNIIQKLRGGAIIIEKAGELNSKTVKELSYLMEKKTGEMLFVLEDERKPLERLLTANPDFKRKFTSKLELPVFINDELVTFGQTYAKENGYKLDEMGILALYSRIDVLQREDHAVTVAEVKEIMDEAIAHSQKANMKHLARRVFGRGKDESDRIILREEDFKI